MALVADYGSDSSDKLSSQKDDMKHANASDDSDGENASQDSYFLGSGSESENSAVKRRRLAEERLTNKEDEASGPSVAALPAPLAVISGTQQPDFLRPEATKQLARPFHRSRAPLTKTVEHKPVEAPKEWDIASMAPKLKGEGDKRGPPGAVITAAAKRYKPDEDGGSVVTAAQVAMLGGQWRPSEEPGSAEAQEAGPGNAAKKKAPSKAMAVSDFLAKGEGGSLLPRNKQDRKDKEKEKRARGQSSVHGWKSEAEMVLRQQYD